MLDQLDLFKKPLTAIPDLNHNQLLTGDISRRTIDIHLPCGSVTTVPIPIHEYELSSYLPTYPAALEEAMPLLIEHGIVQKTIKPEYDFLGMKIIGDGWQQERDSGLQCRNLIGIKTKLRTQGCHLFEISNGEFSVALEFKQFPTYYGAIRAAIPIFREMGFVLFPQQEKP